ncbi:trypsin-like peptidase domain-containing protein [Streptomyces sp. NPDC057445]|uniref:VMAP-C domain-containing protein n=1 Tax=Streptomyces sp. NPDC057445 TaxID=3346136 RepID=UPI00368E2E08
MNLVMAATVRIHATEPGHAPRGCGGGFLGSGFFVAPSWVLTCAHVVMQGEGREVDIVFETAPGRGETTVRGTVVATLPESSRSAPGDPYDPYAAHGPHAVPDPSALRSGGWPAPDLALVQLLRPVEHACVYVTERPGALFAGGTVLYAGWTVADGRPKRLTGRCEVMGTFGGWADADEQIRLDGDWLVPGVSGGPAVDLARGEVVGVLKSRLDSGKGGTSIGVERLRSLPVPAGALTAETDDVYQALFHAHDRYHADRHTSPVGTERTWADVQSELRDGSGGRALSPQQRIDLLGRLAEFPPPVSTHSLLGLLSDLPGSRQLDHGSAPRGWRDGLGALYEAMSGDGALELILRYCMRVIAAERPYAAPSALTAEKTLWEWVKRVADDRLSREFRHELALDWHTHRADHEHHRAPGPGPGTGNDHAPPAERPCILLELEPRGWERDRYDWRIGVVGHTGEVLPVAEDSHGTALVALPARIATPLIEAFRRCDEPGHPAVLQVAVVRALLGLDVDSWRVPPDGPPLGAVRPVVVRCSDLDPPSADDAAQERLARWNRTRTAVMRAAVVDCEDGLRVSVPEVAELRALAHETVPVLCRYGAPPEPQSAAGLVRVLEGGFGVALWRRGTDGSDAVCSEFHRRAADTLTEAGTADRLPRKVHELRRGLLAGRAETFWSDGVALFYDDPHHPLPGAGQLLEAP